MQGALLRKDDAPVSCLAEIASAPFGGRVPRKDMEGIGGRDSGEDGMIRSGGNGCFSWN